MINPWKKILDREDSGNIAKGLLLMEKLCIAYGLLTSLLILIMWQRLNNPVEMIWGRLAILGGTFALWYLYRKYPYRLLRFTRITYQMSMLSFWYPETYEFNSRFTNLDHLFAHWEQLIFHGQPALEFSRALPQIFFSEAFNLGYYSYYPMIIILMVFYFVYQYKEYEKASFIIMCSFFIYYTIYIFVPVAGPQFYFNAIGLLQASSGVFPAIGNYFQYHQEMLPAPGYTDGIFYQLVRSAQDMGERPTAAFPSSHVGITVIMLILAFRKSKKLGFFLLPVSLLLFGATVYIQAHYLIDALAGFISAFLIYALTGWLYRRITGISS